jgi:hypothetical protein
VRRAVLVAAVFLVTGCGGASTQDEGEQAFAVAVSEDAARISERADVDLPRLITTSATEVFSRLPHSGRIRIELGLDASRAIPEVGVGGVTAPKNGDVFLWIDGTPPGGLRHALETWIPQALAHELHHSTRIRIGPGYGKTLGEALISEGLAEHFIDEVFPATPPRPWDRVLSKAEERSLWRQAEPVLWRIYDHNTWFFGGYKVPRWTGYTLGYRIVATYLDKAHSAAGAVKTEAKTIIRPYARQARGRPGKASR